MASEMITELGYRCLHAHNGLQAVDAVKSGSVDLVLMDCQMPVMDGFEATRRLREPASGVLDSRIPVIALTASAFQEDRQRCLEAGMSDFLTKPIDRVALAETLSHLGKFRQPRLAAQAR